MTKNQRARTAKAVAQLMPRIIQGAHLGVLHERRMTQTQFLLLIFIHARGPCLINDLARGMQVRMPTVSGIVDRLEQASYVKRSSVSADRRRVAVALTPQGRRFLKEFQAIITKRWTQVLAALNPSELAAFELIVNKLNDSLGRPDAR